jgi:hypothetical protein
MTVKIKIQLLIALITCALLSPGIAVAQSPTLPVIYQGAVLIDGADAPAGTIIVAEIDGVEVASTAITEDTVEEIGTGKYLLPVPNEGYLGRTVVFKVDGRIAGEHEYVSAIEKPIVEFDLAVQTGSVVTSDTPGNIDDSSAGLFGSGNKAIIGVVAVGVALLILLIVIIKRHRRYI